jgi:hypothetical protein
MQGQKWNLADDELEDRFRDTTVSIYVRAKEEAGYNATRFLEMIERWLIAIGP